MRTIRAVLHDPEGETVYRRIPDTLEAIREHVGGCVEGHQIVLGGRRCVAYCHEEGRLLGMPPSVCWSDVPWEGKRLSILVMDEGVSQ